MFKPDIRVWKPDNSCTSFAVSNAVGSGTVLIIRFKLPRNQDGVLTQMYYSSDGYTPKNVDRLMIGRGSTLKENDITEFWHGSLKEVFTPFNNVHYKGFALMNYGATLDTRIPLEAGIMYSFYSGPGVSNNSILNIAGYTYPRVV